eukprot:COSAG01_NODE_4460_length_5003_cov_6.216150_2_plen_91_part_00
MHGHWPSVISSNQRWGIGRLRGGLVWYRTVVRRTALLVRTAVGGPLFFHSSVDMGAYALPAESIHIAKTASGCISRYKMKRLQYTVIIVF